jgi:6-phosphogluconolactonase
MLRRARSSRQLDRKSISNSLSAISVFYASLLLGLLLLTAGSAAAPKDPPHARFFLYVGTYTKGESKGIYAYRYDASSGKATSLGLAAETVNPSFLTADPTHRFLYAVNELTTYKGATSGAVSAFAIDHQTGKLSLLNEVASRGADPCYIAFDKSGKYVLVANYTSGNVAVFPAKDGRLGESSAFVQHSGKGVNPERQEGPHAHWIETTADNRFAIVADLGLDEVLVYRFDARDGTLKPNDPPFVKVDPGSGPRHISFHPDGKFAYLLSEMKSPVTVFAYDASRGALHPLQTISTLPKDFTGTNDAAEIHVHPNGKFLYASNRGNDSLAIFAIDQKTGLLKAVDHVSTEGKTPRNFEIDPTGSRLLVANQDTGNIVVFNIDGQTGRLTPAGEVLSVPSPVSLDFVPED